MCSSKILKVMHPFRYKALLYLIPFTAFQSKSLLPRNHFPKETIIPCGFFNNFPPDVLRESAKLRTSNNGELSQSTQKCGLTRFNRKRPLQGWQNKNDGLKSPQQSEDAEIHEPYHHARLLHDNEYPTE
ncbi:hypothetical protein NPIL_597771 [Nephila pilipes]|uniref:Uncharacterized protein n=1 Tax=Nephila pilipes TaxID=299642 RepID=A0A8X6MHP6_NEPPI|nr:hypothetical protein NPIL_597771 [Nephila pilipes]